MTDFKNTPDHRAQVSDEMGMIASVDDRISNEDYCQTIQAAMSLYDAEILRGGGYDEGTKWTEITAENLASVFIGIVLDLARRTKEN